LVHEIRHDTGGEHMSDTTAYGRLAFCEKKPCDHASDAD
jgi:hypothetical protein